MNSRDPQFSELSDAARRAGELFSSHVDEITEDAERHAAELRELAQQDADASRRAALEAGRRVFERINALERPLAELVGTLRHEMERVTAELTDGGQQQVVELPHGDVTEDSPPEPEPSAPEIDLAPPEAEPEAPEAEAPEPETEEPQPEPAPQGFAPTVAHDTMDTTAVHETPEAPVTDVAPEAPQPEPAYAQPAPAKPRRGFLRRRSRHRVFLGIPGECAVCQRSYQAESEEELAASGWSISGDVGLCPDCQADGWQLPEGAQLPFRRGAAG